MKILYTNADSLNNKKDELNDLINIKNPDIIAITEINPKNKFFEVTDTFFFINGYTHYTNLEKNKRGVIIYIKDNIIHQMVNINSDEIEMVWIKIILYRQDSLLLGCIYRSPNSSIKSSLELTNIIEKVNKSGCSHLCILGDFNFKDIDWNLNISLASEKHVASLFLEALEDNFLHQHVKQATRFRDGQSPSLIDLVITNEEHMIEKISYLPSLGKSDHVVLEIDFNCYTEKVVKTTNSKRNYFKGNYTMIKEKLRKIAWDELLPNESINDSWTVFVDILHILVEENIPVYRDRPLFNNQLPFINAETRMKLKQKHQAWMKYLNCKTTGNYAKYKCARNIATAAIKKAKYEYERDLALQIKTKSTLFWKYIRSKSKTKSTIGAIKDNDNLLIECDFHKADIFNSYFSSIFNANSSDDELHFEEIEKRLTEP